MQYDVAVCAHGLHADGAAHRAAERSHDHSSTYRERDWPCLRHQSVSFNAFLHAIDQEPPPITTAHGSDYAEHEEGSNL